MSQWAREHPELCAEGVTAYDYYAERGDQARQERKDGMDAHSRTACPRCKGAGQIKNEGSPLRYVTMTCPGCKGTGRA